MGQGWHRTGRAEPGGARASPLTPGKLLPLPAPGIPLGYSWVKDSMAGSSCQVCRELPPLPNPIKIPNPTQIPNPAQIPFPILPQLPLSSRTMLEDEDGMSERGLSGSRRRFEDEEGE